MTSVGLKIIKSLQARGGVTRLSPWLPKIVYIADSEILRKILSMPESLVLPGPQYAAMKPIIGSGMVASSGIDHKRHRSNLMKILSPNKIRQQQSELELEIKKTLDEAITRNEPTLVRDLTMEISGAVATKIIFGNGANPEIAHKLGDALPSFSKYAVWNLLLPSRLYESLPWGLPRKVRRTLEEVDRLIYRQIASEQNRQKLNAEYDNFLGYLIQESRDSHGDINIVDIRDQLVTLFLASLETTASIMAWTILEIDKLKEVGMVDSIFATSETGLNGSPLGEIILQQLRKYPPTYLLTRSINEDINVRGISLKKGTIAVFSLYGIQNASSTTMCPQSYNLRESGNGDVFSHSNANDFMPFGHGPRRCPGASLAVAEITTLASLILNEYKLKLSTKVIPSPRIATTLVPSDIEIVSIQKRYT